MDSGAETVILRLRANFPASRLPPACYAALRTTPMTALTPAHAAPLLLQKATSESSRRIISEEVLRFIKEGSGGEVRNSWRCCC